MLQYSHTSDSYLLVIHDGGGQGQGTGNGCQGDLGTGLSGVGDGDGGMSGLVGKGGHAAIWGRFN